MRKSTAHDVAKRAEVSQSAVSRAFTTGASVSKETKAKVLKAAKELSYRPNAFASSLITRRSKIIAVVASYLQNHFYPEVLEEMSRECNARGYQILLFTAPMNSDFDPLLDDVLRYQVDGIILLSSVLTSKLARECKNANIPVLLFNRTTPDSSISSVTGQNEIGGEAIAKHFLEQGYKDIAFMAGVENSSTSIEREKGFMKGLNRPLFARISGKYHYETAQNELLLLLKNKQPDALFCANDHMAFAALNLFKQQAIKPIAVAGFDDVAPAAWDFFALTTFSQPVKNMVDSAISLIITQIEEENVPVQQVRIAGELKIRNSSLRK